MNKSNKFTFLGHDDIDRSLSGKVSTPVYVRISGKFSVVLFICVADNYNKYVKTAAEDNCLLQCELVN